MSVIEINRALRENFDITDDVTRRTLVEADDADQNQLLTALTSKLYDQIVSKVDDIDFGSIPRSRGDITKIENYPQLTECLSILRSIIEQSKEDTRPVDVVLSAIENLKVRTRLFSKAFAIGVEMPVLVYNTIALAIVSSVSFLIASCIEYIKNPGADTFEIAIDKTAYHKTKDNLLFENLQAFNTGCKNGDVDAALNGVIKNYRAQAESAGCDEQITIVVKLPGEEDKEVQVSRDLLNRLVLHDEDRSSSPDETFREDSSWMVSIPLAIIRCIIPFLRSLVYFFFHAKQSVSDYFAIQAELVEMNAYKVQYSTDLADDKRREVYNRQIKIANTMKNISNRFSINYKRSQKAAEDLQKAEKKKFKVEEFPEVTPSNLGQSVLF